MVSGEIMTAVRRVGFFWLLALGWLTSSVASVAATPSRPNVVIVLADDMGYGDLSSYGGSGISTPSLDRMASEGMRFTNFYSASPLCTPSRAALLTGRLPIRSGLNRVLSPVDMRGIRSREVTIAELLRDQGYATAAIGKWHLGRLPEYLPTRHGFDRYFGLPYSNDMSRKSNPGHPIYRWKLVPPLPLVRDEKIIEREPDQSQLTRRYTEEAIQFIQKSVEAGRPFFLYLAHTSPHPPLHASERFAGKSSRGLYGDVVEELDWSTGEILRTLAALNIEDDTLVIFTSDNGPWLRKGSAGGSADPFREGKGSTYEGGVRMPFLARWPGRIPDGVSTEAFGTLMDLLPTVAGLAGAELPLDVTLDGEDLSGVLMKNEPGREPLIYFWFRSRVRAVRQGPWKLHVIVNEPSNGTRKPTKLDKPQLYHLPDDPGERLDLAADNPEIVRQLTDLIQEHEKSLR